MLLRTNCGEYGANDFVGS